MPAASSLICVLETVSPGGGRGERNIICAKLVSVSVPSDIPAVNSACVSLYDTSTP